MTTNFTAWYPDVRASVSPAIPPPVLLKVVRDAVREFCDETYAWKETLDDINIVADTNTYNVSYSNAEILEVLSAKYKIALSDGSESDDDQFFNLDPASEETLNKIREGNWEFSETTAPSEYYISNDDDPTTWVLSFTSIPTQASTDGLRLRVAIKPDLSATSCIDAFFNKHKDAITYAAAKRLFLMKAMPWYDFEQYKIFRDLFKAECGDAKLNNWTKGTSRSLRVRFNNVAC